MSRFNRIYRIHEILRNATRPVPMSRFLVELEASRNTITRDFEYLRDSLGAPLAYDRAQNGHFYDLDSASFELPGFWMNSGELYALLACEQLLEGVQPGLMAHRLAPLRNRIRDVLGESGHDAGRVNDRIRIQPMQVRITPQNVFDPVAEATLRSQSLKFMYSGRRQQDTRLRFVDPHRLISYRSNWYLLAFCQEADDLRMFSLDRISQPELLDSASVPIATDVLDKYSSASFGIFTGQPRATAHLRFTAAAARWVADEIWHSDQSSAWRDGEYHLWIPFSDPTELIMDILRHGPDVEVLGPEELRHDIAAKIAAMNEIY